MQIKGSQFTIRTWQPEDAASLARNANSPLVSRYLKDRFPYPYTISDAELFIKGHLQADIPVNFAIDIDGEVIGGIGLQLRADIYAPTPLLGYWLSERYWGKGIMAEAVKLVCQYAFESLNAACIVAYVLEQNPQSMRVLEKAGFIRRGIVPKSVVKQGKIMDEHTFSLHPPANAI
nr:GNAT family protein [Mucilaginibacter straminoryzae]